MNHPEPEAPEAPDRSTEPDAPWFGGWFRDLVLLIAGILIAFALDAQWDGRQERVRDRAELLALAAEFDEVIQVLASDSAFYARAFESAERLAGAMRSQENLSREELISLAQPLIAARTMELPSGAYGLVSVNGALGRIPNSELRSLLASWPARVQDTAEGTNWLREQRDREFAPILNEYVALFDVRQFPESPAFQAKVPELLKDREFYGALSYRHMIGRSVVGEIKALLDTARRIRALLPPAGGTS